MSIKYTAVKRFNINKPNESPLYYPGLVKGDEVTFEELIEEVGRLSGINEPYIEGVLLTLEKVLINQLSQGRYVSLGNFGTFYLTFNGKGAETPAKLSVKNIVNTNIRYKPGKKMLKAINSFKFKKVKSNK